MIEKIMKIYFHQQKILKVYKMGETPPPLKEFKNTIKTPSGEPDVGSGNFSVKKSGVKKFF